MLMSPVPEIETVSRDDVEQIAKTRWIFLVMGLLSIVATPPVDGAPRTWAIGAGVVNMALGVILLAWPEPTLRVIAALIGIWFLIAGLVLIVGAVANHDTLPMWWVTLVAGVLSSVLGIWAIVMGTLEVVAAFEVKRLPKQFDKVVASLS
jgi:uncharacterized membrane protein HdeD (DUF308 family)